VRVSLGPDWTESGSGSILEELKWAMKINSQLWASTISPRELVEFVTCNAAAALGMEDEVGRIAPGYDADLVVVPQGIGSVYKSLLHASPKDVMLTVVGGRPLYGDAEVMARFPFLAATESVAVNGVAKTLAISIPSSGIEGAGDSYATMNAACKAEYAAALPHVAAYLPAFGQ